MNFIKKGIAVLLIAGLMISCGEDEKANPKGISEIIFSSFTAEASGDGTLVTVTPVSIGASSFSVDFGDPNSTTDVLLIAEQGGSVSYDYPNEAQEATYTISVTAQSDEGLTPVTLTEEIVVVHVPEGSISTVPDAPTASISNVFAIYTDGMEFDGGLLEYRWGEAASGGTAVTVGDENVIRLSRLGSTTGVLSVATIDPANAFGDGISATHIHFDVYSDFAEGIDVLKVALGNEGASAEYEIDGLSLSDGAWASFDFDLGTDFSAAVDAIDNISFTMGTGGAASDHASIYVDNIYLYKETGATILNGDFEISGTYATSQWRFTAYTDGDTNPFGSSSDGSNYDYDGDNTGDKTRGAKWSSSQVGGPLLHTASSRYAYQALSLTPNTDYVLQYQYAIDDDNDDPAGLARHIAGLVLDGHFMDGADALAAINDNLGMHLGYSAEGKFSDTPIDYGTFAEVAFTSNESGDVAVMLYSTAPDDAWIDNVRVIEASDATAPSADFDSEESTESHLTHTFTNTSINGASFVWDFGDGNTSTEKSPTHTYTADGDYDVVLTATNAAGSSMANETVAAKPPAVAATFKAIVLNGTADEHTSSTSDNADAWDMTPNSTILDESEPAVEVSSPYRALWYNSDLQDWLETNCGDADEQPGSTSDGNKFAQKGDRGVKLYEACRRLYQVVTVEVGVEYTFTIDSRSEASGTPTEVYILNTEITSETGLDANGKDDASVDAFYLIENDFNSTKSSTTDDTFTTTTFTFKPTTTKVVIYVRAPNAIDSATEVFYDNIDIITPGF
ncbi:MAG: PKD domain-containing protein [Cyclobacteriaceae bacterium]